MRRPRRSPRIATVCVRGAPIKHPKDNGPRLALLAAIVTTLLRQDAWHPLDALLLPGGFLCVAHRIGHRDRQERRKNLGRQPAVRALQVASEQLSRHCPGLLLLAGVDSLPSERERSDDLLLGFADGQLASVTRRVFCVDYDGGRRRQYVPTAEDFALAERFMRLANGGTALLAPCYDMFGLNPAPSRVANLRSSWATLRQSGLRVDDEQDSFPALRDSCLSAWTTALRQQRPAVALCAIHGFEQPGREVYWQRHGIAAASAGLGGGLALGAAHFAERLPSVDKAPLASCHVPERALRNGSRRKAYLLRPESSFVLRDEALVRLFAPPTAA